MHVNFIERAFFLLIVPLFLLFTACTLDIKINDTFELDNIRLKMEKSVQEGESLVVEFVKPEVIDDLIIDYRIEHITTEDDDFLIHSEIVSEFNESQTKTKFTMQIPSDGIYEVTESFYLIFEIRRGSDKSAFTEIRKQIQIVNVDAKPMLSVSANNVNETDGSTTISFTLDSISKANARFRVFFLTNSALENDDFSVIQYDVEIVAGQTSVNYPLSIVDDSLNEADENIEFIIVDAENVDTSNVSTTQITVYDNDVMPSLSISNVSFDEGATAQLTVSLDAISGQTVSFDFATSDGTAQDVLDYTASSGTLEFTPGMSSQTISVTLLSDAISDDDEVFTVTLSNPINASLAVAIATVTINQPDTTAPTAVTNFRSTTQVWNDLKSSPVMSWDANLESDLSHYEIELRNASDNSSVVSWVTVGNVSSYRIVNGLLQDNLSSYYANIRAVDTSGNKGVESRISIGAYNYWTVIKSRNISKLALGFYHSCAIVDGGAKCWGYNNGLLGNGSLTNSSSPVDVLGLDSGVTDIATGENFTCAVVNSAVKCWGFNGNGRLGDGTTNDSTTPVDVVGLNSGVQAVSADGGGHACALQDGAVKCWGFNGAGRLGDGTTTERHSPVSVIGLTGSVTSLKVAGLFTCVIVQMGVKCWGYNGDGQMGDGTTSSKLTPTDITGLSNGVQSLEVGDYHGCAIVNGGMKCWGENHRGQLGDGTTTNRLSPTDVLGLGPGSGVQKISVGVSTTCAVVNGGAKCWGFNGNGRLGDGTTTERHTPTDVDGLTNGVQDIVMEDSHACAIVNGSIKCWGYNGGGRVGDGSTVEKHSPVDVVGLSKGGLQKLISINQSSCMLYSGGAYCWGRNQYGQLGDGSLIDKLKPTQVLGLNTGVQDIVMGDSHTCALVNGIVQCWGDNSFGQLGDTSFSSNPSPVIVQGLDFGIQKLVSGSHHNCVINNGSVKCWGGNFQGQLGDSSVTDKSSAVVVGSLTQDIQSLASYQETTCAIHMGNVLCWGDNDFGQTGKGSISDYEFNPVTVLGLGNYNNDIVVGGGHTCSLEYAGVKCWGKGTSGQLGDGFQTDSLVPVDVTGLTSNVTRLSLGQSHSCAYINAQVKCWGENSSGQLGDGSGMNQSTPTDVLGFIGLDFTLGHSQTCGIANGTGFCWGDNQYYQLGDGTNTNSNTAVELDLTNSFF